MRSRCEEDSGGYSHYESAVLGALGVHFERADGLPVAQCTYLEDFNESAPQHCVRADPIHLQMEREYGKLIPPSALHIDPEQAHQLVNDLNTFLGADSLVVGKDNRWYLTGMDASGLDTAPTEFAADRNISLLLPRGDATRQWRKMGSEVQMFLHDHRINKAREADGLLPINALWFWGGAKINPGSVKSGSKLFADSAFARGLARIIGLTAFPMSEAMPALQKKEHDDLTRNHTQINVLDTRVLYALNSRSANAIEEALAAVDRELFAPAVELLLKGRVKELILEFGAQSRWRINRWQYLRFWARSTDTKSPLSSDEFT